MTDEQPVSPDEANDSDPVYRGGLTGGTTGGSSSDPLFGLLLAGAISIGLIPLINSDAVDMRYTLVWGLLALFGVTGWLIGSGPRVTEEHPENLAWGVAFGFILGGPLLAFGGGTLTTASNLLFPELGLGTMLAYIVFVMPLAETLFFRGILQSNQSFWVNALIATAWQIVLFFPLMNQGPYPLIIGIILLMANLMYSYINERNGLAAAWLCQITINILVLFIPFAS